MCLSVTLSWCECACQWGTTFLLFPLIFFEAYHHHYTPPRCCAQRFFCCTPPKLNREFQNAQMTKPYCNRETVNNYANNSSKSVSRAGESFIFMFCDDACKQNCEKTYANKYSLFCLPALGFLGPNWGSKMTPPRALWTPRWRYGEPRWRQGEPRFAKIRQDEPRWAKMTPRWAKMTPRWRQDESR